MLKRLRNIRGVSWIWGRYGAILVLALPLIASALAHELTAIVDTALLGRYRVADAADAGTAAGAVGAVSSLFFAILVVLAVVSIGNQILLAQRLAGNKIAAAGSILRHTLVAVPTLAILVTTVLLFFVEPLVAIFNDDPVVIREGANYLRLRLIGIPFIATQIILYDLYVAVKRARWVLYSSWVVNIVNVAGSGLLIFGVGPFPELGVFGAGLGGLLADVAGLLFTGGAFLYHRYPTKLQVLSRKFSLAEFKKLFRLGGPTVIAVISLHLGSIISFILLGQLGTNEQAAGAILFTAASIFFSLAFGFHETSQVLAARAIGAGQQKDLKKLYLRNLEVVIACFVLFSIPFVVAPDAIFGLFTKFEEVQVHTNGLGLILVAIVLLLGWTMTNVSFVRGSGSTLTEMLTTSGSVWLVQVPFTWLASVVFGWGIVGIMLGYLSFWVARGLSNMFFVLRIFANPEKIRPR